MDLFSLGLRMLTAKWCMLTVSPMDQNVNVFVLTVKKI